MRGAMSSNSSDCVEFFQNIEEVNSSSDPEQSKGESISSSSKHVMPSSDQGVYVLDLGRRINSIHQLTPDQRASLLNNVIFIINNYMVDHLSEMGSSLTHRRGQRQPSEERGSSPDQVMLDQQVTLEVRNAPTSTSRPMQQAQGVDQKCVLGAKMLGGA